MNARSKARKSSSSSDTSSSSSDTPRSGRFPSVPKPVYKAKLEDIILDAKRRHRTDIKKDAWDREGFAGSDVCELQIGSSNSSDQSNIRRESCRDLSVDRFFEEYESPSVPVVIEDIPQEYDWSALRNWDFEKLKEKYKNVRLKCGEDDDGRSIRMKVKHFIRYMRKQTDDSPLYVFDSTFDDDETTKPLLFDYKVPLYFQDDLFNLVSEKRRPPYRWFLIGPKRSGTCVHIDPLDVPKRIAKGTDEVLKGEDDEAVNYFMDILPRIRRKYPDVAKKCIDFIQYPGDTCFIPGGWWHTVLNLDDTIAVTQNFCSVQNFDRVWTRTRSGRKRMAVKWLGTLKEERPELAKRAKKMNKRDGFIMHDKRKLQDANTSAKRMKQ